MTLRTTKGRNPLFERALLATLAIFLLATGPTESAHSAEVDRAARVSTFTPPSSIPVLHTDQRTVDGMPRSAFAQGESVALGIRSPRAAEVFALLIDSHGVVSLLGVNQDGWIGSVDSGSLATMKVVDDAQWSNGLPLGKSMIVLYAFSKHAVADLSQDLRPIEVEEGIVASRSVAALARALHARSGSAQTTYGASQVELALVHAKAPRSRGLGVSSSPPKPQPRLVGREEIIRHFTGPRSRGIQRLRLDVYVAFAFDSTKLPPGKNRQLEEMAAALSDPRLAAMTFRVGGHTDRIGSREYNLELSKSRAEFVRQRLIAEHGIELERLVAEGFAYDQALDPSPTPEADSTNRRVDFQLLRD